jgi:hypothetical protein
MIAVRQVVFICHPVLSLTRVPNDIVKRVRHPDLLVLRLPDPPYTSSLFISLSEAGGLYALNLLPSLAPRFFLRYPPRTYVHPAMIREFLFMLVHGDTRNPQRPDSPQQRNETPDELRMISTHKADLNTVSEVQEPIDRVLLGTLVIVRIRDHVSLDEWTAKHASRHVFRPG